jgi:transcriptional regulator with XRE-family HTH domain
MPVIPHTSIKTVLAQIKIQRGIKNYTQAYVAGKLGISQNAYSKIESGVSSLTVETLFRLSYIFDIDVLAFF